MKRIVMWSFVLILLLNFISAVTPAKEKKKSEPRKDEKGTKAGVVKPSPVPPQKAPATAMSAAPAEVRGLWVVRTTLVSPEKIKELVQRAKQSNFNTLIVQVRGRGDAYYHSRWDPRAEELANTPETFDALAQVIQEGHAAGLKVHAWINVGYTANVESLPTSPDHIVNKHPEWLMVHRGVATRLYKMDPSDPQYLQLLVKQISQDRSEIEGLYASLAIPEVKEHVYDVAMDLIEHYDLDGLHFDYIRYASPAFDYNRTALERFREGIEKTLPNGERKVIAYVAATDPLVYTTVFPDRWAQFRRDQVTEVVERIAVGIRARKPNVLLTAAVFADDENAYSMRFQDWRLWLDHGLVDAVCPMAYTPDTETFKRQIEKAKSYAMGRQIWAGIGAYQMPVEGSIEKIELARKVGVDGVVLFSYDSLIRSSNTNPMADYLEKLKAGVFKEPAPIPVVPRNRGTSATSSLK